MAGRLDAKVCVVTGTGGRTGRKSALAFAREGASVVGCNVSVDAAVRAELADCRRPPPSAGLPPSPTV